MSSDKLQSGTGDSWGRRGRFRATSSGINPPFCLQHSITCTVVDSQFFRVFLLVVKNLLILIFIFKWRFLL